MRPDTRRQFAVVSGFVVVLLLQGCVTAQPGDATGDSVAANAVGQGGAEQQTRFTRKQKSAVAQDLVFVLTRLKEFPARITTLQMVKPSTPFGRQVLSQLRLAGYGLQFVDGDHGQNFVRYRAQAAETEFGVKWEYRLSVGDVQVKREYRLAQGKVLPGSEVRISGTDAQGVVPDDSQFDSALVDPALSKVVEGEERLVAELVELKPEKRLIVAQVTPQTNKETAAAANTVAGGNASTAGSGSPVQLPDASLRKNIYEYRKSNFEAVFKDYESIRREALGFPKDSVQIGIEQENTIAALAKAFREDEHIISIVGYSHGRTGIRNGNQRLAEGRASSVRDALVAAGVDSQRVFFEASWSARPTRAVQWRSAVVKLMGRR